MSILILSSFFPLLNNFFISVSFVTCAVHEEAQVDMKSHTDGQRSFTIESYTTSENVNPRTRE
jgi:hypothetical protein